MSRTSGIVLDGGERPRDAVAELPKEGREAVARRLGLTPNRTQRAAYRDWLGGTAATITRCLRLPPWGAGDRRLYLRKATFGEGRGPGFHGKEG